MTHTEISEAITAIGKNVAATKKRLYKFKYRKTCSIPGWADEMTPIEISNVLDEVRDLNRGENNWSDASQRIYEKGTAKCNPQEMIAAADLLLHICNEDGE